MEPHRARPVLVWWTVAIVLLGLSGSGLLVIFATSVSNYAAILRDLGIYPPAYLEVLFVVAHAVQRALPWLGAGVLALGTIGLLALRVPWWRRRIRRCWDRLPWEMTGMQERIRADLFADLARRLDAGIPLTQAWTQALEAAPAGLRALAQDVAVAVEQPAQLAEALLRTGLADPDDAEGAAQQDLATLAPFVRQLAQEARERGVRAHVRLLRWGCLVLLFAQALPGVGILVCVLTPPRFLRLH